MVLLEATTALSAPQLPEAAQKLCADTLAALQNTDAAPLAKLFSAQASSFLCQIDDAVVRTSRKKLQTQEKWTEKPLLSKQANLTKLQASDRIYAGEVSAEIEDAGKAWPLNGICVYEGGEFRWMMLAILPPAPEDEQVQALKMDVGNTVAGWRDALVDNQIEQLLNAMAPDVFCVAVVGPDYGFYVFSDPDELQMMLTSGQVPGPLVLDVVSGPEGHFTPNLAAPRYIWKFGVAEFQDVPLEAWLHLYRDADGWHVAAVCGLPPKQ